MPRKPNKHKVYPIERFPSKPRPDGRFQKRILGKLYYFGQGGDREAALREYNRIKHDLYAGRTIPKEHVNLEEATLGELTSLYLQDVKGEMTDGNWKQYYRALDRFLLIMRKSTLWAELTVDDFTRYGKYLRSKLGGYAYNRERAAILAMFNYSAAQDWIDRPPKFGRAFRRIPKSALRTTRINKLLSEWDVLSLLGHATGNIFGMILLALNGGYGGADCAKLEWKDLDLDKAVSTMPRAKNNIPRTTPLWPETVFALRRLRAQRPHDTIVFRTRAGKPWKITAIAHEFGKRCDRAGVELPKNVGLYACRHTFATYANEIRDTDARRHIMGRLLPNLDDLYVEGFFHERLLKITEHVRSRLNVREHVGDI